VIIIDVVDEYREMIDDQILGNTAETALKFGGLDEPSSLSIRITHDSEIRDLNKIYRDIDKVTDVLSFEGDFDDPDLGTRYLGDIVISYPQAEFQANKRGHQTIEEIQLLTVHGLLHLLGYDHADEEDKKEMWSLQKQILKKLDLDIFVEDTQD
jgi:probable rRNA maturation factor